MKHLLALIALVLVAMIAAPAVARTPKVAPANVVKPAKLTTAKVVFHMKNNDLNKDGVPMVIELAARLNGYFAANKVTGKIIVVVQDDAAHWMLKKSGKNGKNKAAAMVADLVSKGVQFEICMSDMKKNGWTAKNLLPGVHPLMGALPRIIELQSKGWTYLAY